MYERYFVKAKTVDGNKWVTGLLVAESLSMIMIQENIPTPLGVVVKHHAVNPETLRSCTGIKAKGEEYMYSYDIVKFKVDGNDVIGYIRWNERTAQYLVTNTDWNQHYPLDSQCEYEILGNTIDDFQLLLPQKESSAQGDANIEMQMQPNQLHCDTMRLLFERYGIDYVAICDCGAVTFEGQEVNYSVMLENAPKFFPDVKPEFWSQLKKFAGDYRSCNHCVNRWGLDRCACGSGMDPDKCNLGEYNCGQPQQTLREVSL